MINPELTNAINEQTRREFGASMQYLCIAAFSSVSLAQAGSVKMVLPRPANK